MTIKLSPSAISLFTECPRCFWFKVKMDIKRPSTIFPSLPSGMDKILKEHFDAHRNSSTLPEELKGMGGSLFEDPEKLKTWRNNFQGLRYTDPKTGIVLMGAIDDLFVTSENKYAPLDFKTRGFPLKDNTHEYYQNQMDIYSFLLEKNSLPPANFAILIFYYPNTISQNHDVVFDSVLKKVDISPHHGQTIFQEAIEIIQNPVPPQPSEDCGFCRWLKEMNNTEKPGEEQTSGKKEENPGLGKWM